VIVLFIYFIYLFLVVWVVVAERAAVTGPRRNFVWIFGPSRISFSGNGGPKFRKSLKNFPETPETIDSVARGRASSLAAFSMDRPDQRWRSLNRRSKLSVSSCSDVSDGGP